LRGGLAARILIGSRNHGRAGGAVEKRSVIGAGGRAVLLVAGGGLAGLLRLEAGGGRVEEQQVHRIAGPMPSRARSVSSTHVPPSGPDSANAV
jgi:hypothetical protein